MSPRAYESALILDTVPEPYIRLDNDFRFTFINRAAVPLLGKEPDEVLGRRIWEVFPILSGTSFDLGCRRAQAERSLIRMHNRFDASQPWRPVTVVPDSRGGVCITFPNEKEDTSMEEASRSSEEKFSKAFRCSPAPMSIMDIDSNDCFLDVNEAFERVTGYSREEIVGRTATDIGLFADSEALKEARRRLREDGHFRNLEGRVNKKDGKEIIIQVSSERIILNGNICCISGAVDVTDRRQAERAQQKSEAIYRRLFEGEPNSLILVDRASRQILAANAAALDLYGYDREEILSLNMTVLSAEPEKSFRAALTTATFIPLRWHKKKDGAIFPVQISSAISRSKIGRSSCTLSMLFRRRGRRFPQSLPPRMTTAVSRPSLRDFNCSTTNSG